MASKTPAGKLRGKVTIGKTADGKPIIKYVSADTPRELEIAKQAAREHFIYGRELPTDMVFAEYAENWYRLRKEPFISNSSKASYRVCFMKHLLPEFGLQKMRALGADQIQAFVNSFDGASRSQIAMIIGTLKAIFSLAYAQGAIERDPTVALVRPNASETVEKRPLTKEETMKVIATARSHPEGAFLAVLYYLGVRRGEALGLKWGDFEWDAGQVHIQRDIDFTGAKSREDTLKTRASDRYIPIPQELHDLLYPRREYPDTLVFHDHKGRPISQGTYKRMWARLMVACGLVEWKDRRKVSKPDDILNLVRPLLTPHYFRHNYVTLLYESGVDPLIAMKIVGHSNYQTTADIYTHIKEETLRKATVNMGEVFRSKEA